MEKQNQAIPSYEKCIKKEKTKYFFKQQPKMECKIFKSPETEEEFVVIRYELTPNNFSYHVFREIEAICVGRHLAQKPLDTKNDTTVTIWNKLWDKGITI